MSGSEISLHSRSVSTSLGEGASSNDRPMRSPVEPVEKVAPEPAPVATLAQVAFYEDRRGTAGVSVEQQRVERLSSLLGSHRYVSFQLVDDDGRRAVHLTRPKDRPDLIAVHVANETTLPSGARYSSLEVRSFFGVKGGAVEAEFPDAAARLDQVLDRVEAFMAARATRPLMVNVSTQGFHERSRHLVLGLADTGGQDQFIEDIAKVTADLGFQVVNVNRGGPSHPDLGFVREGMHYGADGVDMLYLHDGNDAFIRKEDMYDTVEPVEGEDGFSKSRIVQEGPCHKLAAILLQHLRTERHPVALVGHYADGGETIRLCTNLMRLEGREVPKVVHIPHSTGLLKAERLQADGGTVDPGLRIPDRVRTESEVYESTDVLLSTSRDMTESLENGYGTRVHDTILIGVQTDRFHPREPGVGRDDPRYDAVWQDLSKISGRSIPELQAAQMVLEYSRTSAAKDKGTTIRAFAESLKEADQDRILVMNIADPNGKGVGELDRAHARELHDLIDTLGLRGKIITQGNFPNERCALLCQLADVYISSAKLEPWGMAVQEAAASGLPIVASTAVAIASERLVGDQRKTIYEGGQPVLTKGPGALMFKPGDYRSAAFALNRLLNEGGQEERQSIAKGAYDAVIPECTWPRILTRLWGEHLGVQFKDGLVVADNDPSRDS
ncbi:MAG: glycosyltransferase [Deltaproteobacteria bacterium]|nr:glycosyltransferase [Deltaproteobacteria bacterium]